MSETIMGAATTAVVMVVGAVVMTGFTARLRAQLRAQQARLDARLAEVEDRAARLAKIEEDAALIELLELPNRRDVGPLRREKRVPGGFMVSSAGGRRGYVPGQTRRAAR